MAAARQRRTRSWSTHAGSIPVGSGRRCSDEGGVAALDRLPDPGAAVGRVVAVAVLDLLGLDRQRLVLTALAPRPKGNVRHINQLWKQPRRASLGPAANRS